MSYSYQNHRVFVFTEDGQAKFLSVLAKTRACLALAESVRAGVLLDAAIKAGRSGDSWNCMTVVERLVELDYLRVFGGGSVHCAWQDQVFIAGEKVLP